MASEPTITRRTSLAAIVFNTVALILAIVLIVAIGTLLYDRFTLPRTTVAPSALPTAIVAPRPAAPAYQPLVEQPAISPADAIANYNATETARYQEVTQPQPNVNNTQDVAPLERESKPADRQPAGENVP